MGKLYAILQEVFKLTRTWLFGEAEYESTETFQENYDRLFGCCEACGYMIEVEETKDSRKTMILDGSDMEHIRIKFVGDKVERINKWQYTDRKGYTELIGKEEIVVN